MASHVKIWRSAMQVIQDCGQEQDAKAFAFGKASEYHDKGNMTEAARWAEIANAIDAVLEGVELPEHLPTALH